METYFGKIEENPYGDFYGVTTGIRIGQDEWIESIFRKLEGKNVKVTIEVLPDYIEEDDSHDYEVIPVKIIPETY